MEFPVSNWPNFLFGLAWMSERRLTTIWYIQTFATLVMWYKLLYYLRMFRSTSYLVRAFITILSQMFAFMLLYIISVLCFSQAFYIVSNYHEKYIPETFEDPEEIPIYEQYLVSWTAVW